MTEKEMKSFIKTIAETLTDPTTTIYGARWDRGTYQMWDPKLHCFVTRPSDILTVTIYVAPKAKRRRPKPRK